MRMWQAIGVSGLALLMLSGSFATAPAADFGIGPPPDAITDPTPFIESYLDRQAVLLMVRASFGVVADDAIEALLGAELKRMSADGPSEADNLALDAALNAEGSYFIVSLKYLIEVGGAAWPDDRPEADYAKDALVELAALQQALADAIATRADPLPVFERLVKLLALTEGHLDVPAELDHFAGRDDLVARVIDEQGPRTDA